jgi:hypothetical protein
MSDTFYPIVNKIGLCGKIVMEEATTKFHRNPSSVSPADSCGRTDMTKVIGALREYANAPRKGMVTFVAQRKYWCVEYNDMSAGYVTRIYFSWVTVT